jgi:multidrug efflux system membrane fusion protein
VRPGVPARITVMTNHNRTFEGVVDSVGSGVLPEGGSVIEGLPVIQKSINWVHVSQRFPVKIAVKDPDPNCSAWAPRPAPFCSRNKETACRASGHF